MLHVKSYLLPLVLTLTTLTGVNAEDSDKSLSVTGHNKTAIIPEKWMKEHWYDGSFHFFPAIRAGDYVFLSGVIVDTFGKPTPISASDFKDNTRKMFKQIQATLEASGATMDSIVKITTFHSFNSPKTELTKTQQVQVIADIKSEFIGEPHPAWTAVGTTALLADDGLVEIDITAYSPQN